MNQIERSRNRYIHYVLIYSALHNISDRPKKLVKMTLSIRKLMNNAFEHYRKLGGNAELVTDEIINHWSKSSDEFVDNNLDIVFITAEFLNNNIDIYNKLKINVSKILSTQTFNDMIRTPEKLRLAKAFYNSIASTMNAEYDLGFTLANTELASDRMKRLINDKELVLATTPALEESIVTKALGNMAPMFNSIDTPLGYLYRYDNKDVTLFVIPSYIIFVNVDKDNIGHKVEHIIDLKSIIGYYVLNSNWRIIDDVLHLTYQTNDGVQKMINYHIYGGDYTITDIKKYNNIYITPTGEVIGYNNDTENEMQTYSEIKDLPIDTPKKNINVRHSYTASYKEYTVFRYVDSNKMIYGYVKDNIVHNLGLEDVSNLTIYANNPFKPKQKLYLTGKVREPILTTINEINKEEI